jgi:hypothetical protein
MSLGRVERVIKAGRRSDKAQMVTHLFRRIRAKRLASVGHAS